MNALGGLYSDYHRASWAVRWPSQYDEARVFADIVMEVFRWRGPCFD